MSAFNIDVDSAQARQVLARLGQRGDNLQPLFEIVGEAMVERVKRRFETSTAPDGASWKPWASSTARMIAARIGQKKSYRKKGGGLNAKGQRALQGRRLLVDTGELSREIYRTASASQLVVTAAHPYAAIHQFGGNAGRGLRSLIPARPFMPIQADGSLYPAEEAEVLDAINDYLMNGL